jgi:hypothetical protein
MTQPESEGIPVQVQQTERSFTQATEAAMGTEILLGLIELITNSDDQYGSQAGSILVRLPKVDPEATTWQAEVRDKATGVADAEIEPKLLRFGGRTSGHERGEEKRGNRGRGAKDVSHFGAIRWDLFKDGKYAWVWLDRHGNGKRSPKPLDAGPFREQYGIPKNGVAATIMCDKTRIRRPQRDRIKQRLEYAVQLRDIMSNPKRTVKLQYGDEDAVPLRYVQPSGLREFPPVEVDVAGYPGKATIVVAEVPTPFQDEQGDPSRLGGLLIKSGRAVHEATLYGFENDPYAGYFLGSVRWDTIEQLSRDFDDRDEERLPIESTNPAPIIRADRKGLNPQHPAVKALRAAVEPILKPHFERKARELGGGAKESRVTKQRLDALARIVARFQARKAEELEFELSQQPGRGTELTPETPILEVVPPRKLLEYGRIHTFSVRLRADALVGEPETAEVVLWLAADPESCLELSGSGCTVTKDPRLESRLTGTFTAKALSAEGTGVVEVTSPGLASATVDIDIVEPEEVPPPVAPPTFMFERPTYRVAAGKRKRILLLAPSTLVEEHGSAVTVTSSNSQGVLIRHPHAELERSPDGDWFHAVIDIEGRQHGAASVLTAVGGRGVLTAIANVSVRRDQTGPTPPEIKLAAMPSPVRGTVETSETGVLVITVNATHPAAKRYFGPQPEFPGQETVEARLLVAEVVADLTVLDVLRRHLRLQPLAVEQLYTRRFRMLNELLPLCHASQLGDDELESRPARKRGKTSKG